MTMGNLLVAAFLGIASATAGLMNSSGSVVGFLADGVLVFGRKPCFLLDWLGRNARPPRHRRGRRDFMQPLKEIHRAGVLYGKLETETVDLPHHRRASHRQEQCELFDNVWPMNPFRPLFSNGVPFVSLGKFRFGTRARASNPSFALAVSCMRNVRIDTHFLASATLAAAIGFTRRVASRSSARTTAMQVRNIKIVSEGSWGDAVKRPQTASNACCRSHPRQCRR